MSGEKKRKLSENDVKSKEVISVEDDMEDSPVKKHYMAHNREESSYLPDYVAPTQNQNRKIIKKVRFHDDDPVEVQAGPVQPKVGTKRKFAKRSEVEVSEESSNEEMDDESFHKSDDKVEFRQEPSKRQKVDEKP